MSLNLFDLKGKTALVTGGSKGLGKAMARGFVEAGADIIISSRHGDELQKALDEILKGTSRKGLAIVADMCKRDDVDRLVKRSIDEMGKVDILVNNAGGNTPQAIDKIDDKTWDNMIELNLRSVMALTRAFAPGMKERRWGRIIHISSIMAFISKEGRNTYSATKAALVGMARASAADLGAYNITVNCIAPGPFLTDLPMSLLSEAEKKQFSDHTCLLRWGRPDELIGPVLLLASEAGSYISGETVVVDGGYIAR